MSLNWRRNRRSRISRSSIQGREVGLLARQMFPGGVAVEFSDREQAIRTTRQPIENPEIPAIFEGAVAVLAELEHFRKSGGRRPACRWLLPALRKSCWLPLL